MWTLDLFIYLYRSCSRRVWAGSAGKDAVDALLPESRSTQTSYRRHTWSASHSFTKVYDVISVLVARLSRPLRWRARRIEILRYSRAARLFPLNERLFYPRSIF